MRDVSNAEQRAPVRTSNTNAMKLFWNLQQPCQEQSGRQLAELQGLNVEGDSAGRYVVNNARPSWMGNAPVNHGYPVEVSERAHSKPEYVQV